MPTTKGTVELFEKHGFKPVFKESPGRPHLDQLARVSDRVRAAAVPGRPRESGHGAASIAIADRARHRCRAAAVRPRSGAG